MSNVNNQFKELINEAIHNHFHDKTETEMILKDWLYGICEQLDEYEYIINVDWKDKFIPKTGIDKEIAEEEKEIAELERQKEKMDTLANLKRRKERLFEEVHEEGYAHCKWCCGENTLKTALTRDGISYHICTLCGFEQ